MIEAVEENGLSGQEEFDKYIIDIHENSKLIETQKDVNLQLIVKRLITFGKDVPTTKIPSGRPSGTIVDYICQEKGWLDDEEKELTVEHMM